VFWGIKLLPGKPYSRELNCLLTVSHAAIVPQKNSNSTPVTLRVSTDDKNQNFLICTLRPHEMNQTSISLVFEPETRVKFITEGNSEVHLTGYFTVEPDDYNIEDKDKLAMLTNTKENGDKNQKEKVKGKPKEKIIPERKEKQIVSFAEGGKNKRKAKETPIEEVSTKKQKTSKNFENLPQIKKYSSGLLVEEITEGNGRVVAPGKNVSIKYIGTLKNGKKFDSNSNFQFRVGTGQVIRGMDEGLKGMKVGGKRKITIPPALGYGKKAQPKIPANSTLIFTVDLNQA